MAFQDTYAYINRLHHVWEGKPSVTEAESRIGFARAANVLERFQIAVIGEDPIARSVASRMWNIATATTDNSGMMLCDSEVPTDVDLVLEIASDELPADAAPRATIALAECHNLAQRIRAHGHDTLQRHLHRKRRADARRTPARRRLRCPRSLGKLNELLLGNATHWDVVQR